MVYYHNLNVLIPPSKAPPIPKIIKSTDSIQQGSILLLEIWLFSAYFNTSSDIIFLHYIERPQYIYLYQATSIVFLLHLSHPSKY